MSWASTEALDIFDLSVFISYVFIAGQVYALAMLCRDNEISYLQL